jgi:hypothetical protein
MTTSKKQKMRGKLDDRGRPCIVIGRAENHHRDVYRFLNLETDKIIRSRDTLWLNQQDGNLSQDAPKDEEAGREPETEVDRIEVVHENDSQVVSHQSSDVSHQSSDISQEVISQEVISQEISQEK